MGSAVQCSYIHDMLKFLYLLSKYKTSIANIFWCLFNHFHGPHFRNFAHGQDLICWLYAQSLKLAPEGYQKYKQKDNLG